ncbi:VanZ family protein [Haloferax sp. S1W]|uniref:VanZ family protein n=1 Tax=Haloferax sp. S1W TaxID=3377110 RepID=UPI0037CB0353
MTITARAREHPYSVVAVYTYAIAILVASVIQPSGTGLASQGPLGLVGVDKWLHAGAYAGLGFGVAFALRARAVSTLLVAVVIATVYGMGIELFHGVLSYRTFAVADMLANALGATLGGLLWAVVRSIDRGG